MSAEMCVTFSTYSSDRASVFCSCSTEGLWLWKQPIPVRMMCLQVAVVNNEDALYEWSVVPWSPGPTRTLDKYMMTRGENDDNFPINVRLLPHS